MSALPPPPPPILSMVVTTRMSLRSLEPNQTVNLYQPSTSSLEALESSPTPLSASPRTSHEEQDQPVPASSCRPPCARIPCQQGLRCPRHPRLSALYQRARSRSSGSTESPKATEDDPPCHLWSPHHSLSDNVETDCSSVQSQPSTKPGDNTGVSSSTQDKGVKAVPSGRDSANAKSTMQSSP